MANSTLTWGTVTIRRGTGECQYRKDEDGAWAMLKDGAWVSLQEQDVPKTARAALSRIQPHD